MQKRHGKLRQLVDLYAMLEEERGAETRLARMLLRQTEETIAEQERDLWLANADGRMALSAGDRLGWVQSKSKATLASEICVELGRIQEERSQSLETAKRLHQASRLQREQIGGLLRYRTTEMEMLDRRRGQEETDDRYLARRRWHALQTAKLANRRGHCEDSLMCDASTLAKRVHSTPVKQELSLDDLNHNRRRENGRDGKDVVADNREGGQRDFVRGES